MTVHKLPEFEGLFVKAGHRFAYVLKEETDPYGGLRVSNDVEVQVNGHGRPADELEAILDVIVATLNGQEPAFEETDQEGPDEFWVLYDKDDLGTPLARCEVPSRRKAASSGVPPGRLRWVCEIPEEDPNSDLTQTYGTFYDVYEGRSPCISCISAYVRGNYNPQWSGCVEIEASGETWRDRNRQARLRRLEMELLKVNP